MRPVAGRGVRGRGAGKGCAVAGIGDFAKGRQSPGRKGWVARVGLIQLSLARPSIIPTCGGAGSGKQSGGSFLTVTHEPYPVDEQLVYAIGRFVVSRVILYKAP